jgi:hypothetical protein
MRRNLNLSQFLGQHSPVGESILVLQPSTQTPVIRHQDQKDYDGERRNSWFAKASLGALEDGLKDSRSNAQRDGWQVLNPDVHCRMPHRICVYLGLFEVRPTMWARQSAEPRSMS